MTIIIFSMSLRPKWNLYGLVHISVDDYMDAGNSSVNPLLLGLHIRGQFIWTLRLFNFSLKTSETIYHHYHQH